MPSWGITPAGFSSKPLTQILADLQAAWLANVDPTADLSPTTPEGQILGIISNAYAELWEIAQAAWNAYNREDVEGAGLDNLGDISGTPRDGPTFTQVVCNATLAAGTYAAGSLVANVQGNTALTFSNLNSVTSTGGVNVVLFQSTTIGPTGTIAPGTLNAITTPVTGWTAITNPAFQSQLGQDDETDTAYAVRQQQDIAGDGGATPPATVAALNILLQTTYANEGETGPFSASLFENTGDSPLTIDTLTIPPKSFAAIIYDPSGIVPATGPATAAPGSGQGSIASTIWQNKPVGISSFGSISGVVADPFLGNQTVSWSEPTQEPLFITATVAIYPGQVWDNGSGAGIKFAIQAALVAAAIATTPSSGIPPTGQLTPGASVIGSQLEAVILSVPGAYAVQVLEFDFVSSPTNTADITDVSPLEVATIAQVTVATNVLLTQGVFP